MSTEAQPESWTLERSGRLRRADVVGAPVVLDPERHTVSDVLPGANGPVHINFGSFADGRGFSLARQLRARHGASLLLVATGHVLPDQARHAFQSGFDEILISDNALAAYGEEAWRTALTKAVGSLYVGEIPGGNIWNRRHGHATGMNV